MKPCQTLFKKRKHPRKGEKKKQGARTKVQIGFIISGVFKNLNEISIYQIFVVICQLNIDFGYQQLGFHIFCKVIKTKTMKIK
jgi:hypothetical protein